MFAELLKVEASLCRGQGEEGRRRGVGRDGEGAGTQSVQTGG